MCFIVRIVKKVTFKIYDYIALFVFTHIFYYGIVGILLGSYVGGIILIIGWECWKAYERWRVRQ
jgi:hypothetical protein